MTESKSLKNEQKKLLHGISRVFFNLGHWLNCKKYNKSIILIFKIETVQSMNLKRILFSRNLTNKKKKIKKLETLNVTDFLS